jgi:quercetin dioxygenase-like cupin family protein
MVTRREALKTFALGSALLSPELFERLAQADSTATPGAMASAPIVATGDGVVVRQMMMQPLPMPGNRVAVMVVVEYAPGAASPPHWHPGPVFGYVLQGRVAIGIDQRPPVTYAEGDVWYEAPRHTHRVSRNASITEPAKLLAFLILEKGQPLLEKVKVPA